MVILSKWRLGMTDPSEGPGLSVGTPYSPGGGGGEGGRGRLLVGLSYKPTGMFCKLVVVGFFFLQEMGPINFLTKSP